MTQRSRGWCFTINNPEEGTKEKLTNIKCQYMICGEEIAPTTGTKHIQGYVYFSDAKTFSAVQKKIQGHLEPARGSPIENKRYCTKVNTYLEQGTIPNQGERSDLEDVANMIKKKTSMKEIADAYPSQYIRYHRGFDALARLQQVDRTEKPYVEWRWGLAGVGKTRYVIEKHKNLYIKDGTPWWDGYNQEEAILIDDFDNQIPYRTFLRLLDRYAYQGQVKGGYVKINSPYIYITSEHPPQYYWMGNELDQVTRRIDQISEITQK